MIYLFICLKVNYAFRVEQIDKELTSNPLSNYPTQQTPLPTNATLSHPLYPSFSHSISRYPLLLCIRRWLLPTWLCGSLCRPWCFLLWVPHQRPQNTVGIFALIFAGNMYIQKPHIPTNPTAGILVNEDHVADRVVNKVGPCLVFNWTKKRKKKQGVGLALGTILSKLRCISPSINIAIVIVTVMLHYSSVQFPNKIL